MIRTFICITLMLFIISGCQSNQKIEEVVNNHGDIQNLDGLYKFVENVKKKNQTKINYVQYGKEGQQGISTLTFDGEKINVSRSVDGDFIEEYNCNDIVVKTEIDGNKYMLSECTGDFNGDVELLQEKAK